MGHGEHWLTSYLLHVCVFSCRSCWKISPGRRVWSWTPLNRQRIQTKRRFCSCPLTLLKRTRTCRFLWTTSWITFALWTRPTSQSEMGSFTGTVGDDGENQCTLVKYHCQSPVSIHTSRQFIILFLSGQDLCSASKHKVCPRNSLCINTLGSFACVCQHGFYDVRAVSKIRGASKPICNGIVAPFLEANYIKMVTNTLILTRLRHRSSCRHCFSFKMSVRILFLRIGILIGFCVLCVIYLYVFVHCLYGSDWMR